ncbi:hypothetical protein [Flexivirga caeni]|uniref:DUF8017 domain-containing protein n=1 Tax=Flexivirga caeni TaxID=2294115 RepID=A0A3M9MI76_9MICO|nr:hypothetical protein [Flexivirga caeni]RNI25204.1 hypothetical protein EFY87_00735 [Flexivirga caeni]
MSESGGGGRSPEENNGQWSGGQQPWTGGQQSQPPSWSTGETRPNAGPTMSNPQSSYYDQFSAASGEGVVIPPEGGGGGGRGKVLIGVAAALVVVIAAVAIFALTRGGSSPKKAAATPAATSSLPPVTPTTWVNPTMAAGARALQAGWKAQTASGNAPGVYDVPISKDWKVDPSGWTASWGSAESVTTLAVINGPAEFGDGYCPSDKKDRTAVLGLSKIGNRDPAQAGPAVAEQFAKVLTLNADATKVTGKQGTLSAGKQITVDQGSIPALEYTITATSGAPNACEKGKTYEIRTVTFSADKQSYQLVAIRLLGVKPELSDKELDEIISTFRPN